MHQLMQVTDGDTKSDSTPLGMAEGSRERRIKEALLAMVRHLGRFSVQAVPQVVVNLRARGAGLPGAERSYALLSNVERTPRSHIIVMWQRRLGR